MKTRNDDKPVFTRAWLDTELAKLKAKRAALDPRHRRFSDREKQLAMDAVRDRHDERGFVTSTEARRIIEGILGRTTHPTVLRMLSRHGYRVSGRGPLATWTKIR